MPSDGLLPWIVTAFSAARLSVISDSKWKSINSSRDSNPKEQKPLLACALRLVFYVQKQQEYLVPDVARTSLGTQGAGPLGGSVESSRKRTQIQHILVKGAL